MPEKRIGSFFDRLITGSGVLSGFFILLTAILVGFEVVMRYVLNAPTTWTFDVTLFLIIYSAYLGSAYTMRQGKHVRVEFFTQWLSRYRLPSTVLAVLCNLVLLVFWGFATWTTFRETITAYEFSEVTQSYLRFPMVIPLLAIVLGGALIILQLIADTISLCRPGQRRSA